MKVINRKKNKSNCAQPNNKPVVEKQQKTTLLPKTKCTSKKPLPIRHYTGRPENNISGEIFGNFEVIGLSAQWGVNKKGTAWVVRCRCGIYTIRRRKTLKFIREGKHDFCKRCLYDYNRRVRLLKESLKEKCND